MRNWLNPGSAFADKTLTPIPLTTILVVPLLVVLAMWFGYWADFKFNLSTYQLGIYPRKWEGLGGVIFAPLVHGDMSHLVGNTLPMLLLGAALFYFYPKKALWVIGISWLVSGLLVWLFARPSYHIGASGLVYSLVGFIFFSGLFRAKSNLLALSLLVAFVYGGLFWGLLPVEEKISHEAHIAGGAIGLLLAVYFRGILPTEKVKPERDLWEDDDLSHEIAKFGENYWEPSPQESEEPKVVYFYKSKDS